MAPLDTEERNGYPNNSLVIGNLTVRCGTWLDRGLFPSKPIRLAWEGGLAHQEFIDGVRRLAAFADGPDHE